MKTFIVYYGGNSRINMETVTLEADSLAACAKQVSYGLYITEKKWISPAWVRFIEEVE